MIDISTEKVITLTEAARGLPRRRAGRPVHPSCLFRWSRAPGCKGIVLETVQIGGTRCTSREALARFFEALTVQAEGQAPAAPPSSKHRRNAIEAAERRCARVGA